MLIRSRALVALLTLIASGPTLAVAAKLDDDDKKWLEEVRPVMTQDEERIFKDLEKKADRDEFRVIFWARRDPDLSTPENEYQPEFQARREKADKDFRVPGRKGSATDCGRTLVLLGEPDDSEVQVGGVSVLSRVPEVWIYKDKEGQTFDGGEARIRFDSNCRAPSGIAGILDNIAQSKIVQPQLDYKVGEDGRLVSLEDQLPKDSPARALLKAPRQDFEMAADTRFMRVADGSTAVIGVIHGTAENLPVEKKDGAQIANIVIATSALDEAGVEVSWTEQPVRALVQEDGSFIATYGASLPAGKYNLKVATAIGDSETPPGAVVTHDIEVPDFSEEETAPDGTTRKVPSVASILFVRDIQDMPEGSVPDPEDAFASYRLGLTQLVPHNGREMRKSDSVIFFYVIYDLGVDPSNEKADSVVSFSILKAGRTPVAQAPETPIETTMMASTVGPVPMTYPPGDYVVRLSVTDNITGKTVVKDEDFTILAPEGAAP